MLAPPMSATCSANVGASSVRPVAARSRSRKSGRPTETGFNPSPSSRAMALPKSPWVMGKQPVAIEAELTRVAEGKTLRCCRNRRPVLAIWHKLGVSVGVTMSARRPSMIMRTARFMVAGSDRCLAAPGASRSGSQPRWGRTSSTKRSMVSSVVCRVSGTRSNTK